MEIFKRGTLNNLNFETTTTYEKEGDAKSKYQSTYPLNLENVEKEIDNTYSFIGFLVMVIVVECIEEFGMMEIKMKNLIKERIIGIVFT